MNTAFTWRDAYSALNSLTPAERNVLPLLAWLPCAPTLVLEPLLHLGRSRTCECLAVLRKAGLVSTISAPTVDGRPTQLSHLSDLGLAVLSIVEDEDPVTLARQFGLTGRDLARQKERLPHLLALYELLALIARSPELGELLAWERPWHQGFKRAGGSRAMVSVPAYAALATADGGAAHYLLLPDRGVVPVAAYRETVAALFQLRAVRDGQLPPLVVAVASEERAEVWAELIEGVRRGLGEAGLAASVATWEDLAGCNGRLPMIRVLSAAVAEEVGRPTAALRSLSRQPGRRLPTLVGSEEPRPLSSGDLGALELIGCHAFLEEEQVATLQGWASCTAAECCQRLVAGGLVQRLAVLPEAVTAGSEEVPPSRIRTKCDRFVGLELTRAGLEVVAANQGLPTHVVTKHLGLAAAVEGERAKAKKRREGLLYWFDHTRAVNRMHVRFVEDARRRRGHGWDDAITWQPAAVCGEPLVRPDAYLVYHRGGKSWGAFVEVDTGTERRREYRRKFRAYWEYHDSGSYERKYNGCPAILVITVDKEAEDRIVRNLLGMGLGRSGLPVFVTNEQRLDQDPAGFLGLVWRGAEDGFGERHAWPPRS